MESLLETISTWLPFADGITISGGEPFDQPDALFELLRWLRANTTADILVYSGYPIEQISMHIERMQGLIDVLISDPFDLEVDQSAPLRGSNNQRLHMLSDMGRERFKQFERPIAEKDKAFDLMLDQSGVLWLAGIPARNDFRRLKDHLEKQHNRIRTTEDTARRHPAGKQ